MSNEANDQLFGATGEPDWEAILRRGLETKDLDYKGPGEWNERDDKKACCELVKDIMAMANTKGGYIVAGVSENKANGTFSWDGLSDEQCRSFETSRINRFLQNYTDPPINAHAKPHQSNGKRFVIIVIPRFPDTPHICQKDYPRVLTAGDVYVRTDNNESAPIRNSSDMRAIVEHAIRNRSDQLLSSFRAILTGTPQVAGGPSDLEQFTDQVREAVETCGKAAPKRIAGLGYRETVIHPGRFERLRFTIPELEEMAEGASVSFRGWPFIFYADSGGSAVARIDEGLETLVHDSHVCQFWRLGQSGLLYVNEEFHEDKQKAPNDERVLSTNGCAYMCVEAVQCLVDLFAERLPDDEEVRLQMRLHGMRGRVLATPRGGSSYFPSPYKSGTDQIIYDNRRTLADWRAGVVPRALEILQYIHKKFDAPSPPEEQVSGLMQKLLNRKL